MNRISIIGRLVADPEQRTTPNGVSVCTFTIAVNRRFNREETDFFPVTAWRELGANCSKYLVKGSQAAVSGSLYTRKYETDGVKRLAIDIQADDVEFLGSRGDVDGGGSISAPSTNTRPAAKKQAQLEEVDDGGSLPF